MSILNSTAPRHGLTRIVAGLAVLLALAFAAALLAALGVLRALLALLHDRHYEVN